jgi:hypothetical protein
VKHNKKPLKGLLQGKSMEIPLNAGELILAAHHSGLIEGVKMMQNQRGVLNNNRICNQGDFAIHYTGMLGEIAVGKAIGVNVRTDLTFAGDGFVDMFYDKQSIQVKTSTHAYLKPDQVRYLIFTTLEEFSTDWAVLCSVKSPALVVIHGFVSRKKFMVKQTKQNFGYGDRFCLDEKFLTPIERFQEAVRSSNAS